MPPAGASWQPTIIMGSIISSFARYLRAQSLCPNSSGWWVTVSQQQWLPTVLGPAATALLHVADSIAANNCAGGRRLAATPASLLSS